MRRLLIATLALALAFGVTPIRALDTGTLSGETLSRHYDPGHTGHFHQCKACKFQYHQPGDLGPNQPGTFICPKCGYNNSPALSQPQPNPPYINPNYPHPPTYPSHPVHPTHPVHPQPADPQQDPEYQRGYQQGYRDGFRDSYQDGFNRGRQAGEEEGRREGEAAGANSVFHAYMNYRYTNEKLKDLIAGMQLPPHYRAETRAAAVDVDSLVPQHATKYHSSLFTQGYNDGLTTGRREGRDKGYWDGRSERYDRVYPEAYNVGRQQAHRAMHYQGNRLLSMGDQLRIGMEHLARGEWDRARMRFNLILMEESAAGEPSFRPQAWYYAGEALMKSGQEDEALAVFLVHLRQHPREMLEQKSLAIGKLLLDVKTGGFIGIGSTKYYDRAKAILEWWLTTYPGGEGAPDALYHLGRACEKLKQKDEAKGVYQQVIERYPNTHFAAEAKKRIKKLNGGWF